MNFCISQRKHKQKAQMVVIICASVFYALGFSVCIHCIRRTRRLTILGTMHLLA